MGTGEYDCRTIEIFGCAIGNQGVESGAKVCEKAGGQLKSTSMNFHNWPCDNVAGTIILKTKQQDFGDCTRSFELASVTKLLSAYGFLIAVEEGIFELDQKILNNGATVAHLLAHAGGVGFQKGDPERPIEQRRIYSSYGFELLADAISTEAGMSFADYLREAVFEPLGMNDTVLWGSSGHEARSTVADLSLFVYEVLKPTLLAEETVALACTEHFSGLNGVVPGYGMQKPCPWGLGFEIHGAKTPHWLGSDMPSDVVGHFGQSGTYIWIHRPTGRAMVVLTDRPFGQWAKPLWTETNNAIWQD